MDLNRMGRHGLVTLVAGAALLGGSGAAVAVPVLHQLNHRPAAGAAARAPLAAVSPAPDQYNPAPPRPAASPPVQLRIASIGVDTAIEPVGVTADYWMATPQKTSDAGWYAFGAVPGQTGDAVIDGHLDTQDGGPAVFSRLAQLRVGDDVVVVLAEGRQAHFTVSHLARVPYTSRPPGLFETGGPPRLTLITCAGSWDAQKGVYADRLVVDATVTPSTN